MAESPEKTPRTAAAMDAPLPNGCLEFRCTEGSVCSEPISCGTWMLRPHRGLLFLFGINVASILLHYADNVIRLKLYPDLPTTTPLDITLFGAVMLAVGLIGILMYVSEKLRAYSFYLLYIYIAMNLVVLGHYLPSRLRGSFFAVDPSVHFTILFEALSAVMLTAYVPLLHYRFLRKRNAAQHRILGG
jgi:hypothetical protein